MNCGITPGFKLSEVPFNSIEPCVVIEIIAVLGNVILLGLPTVDELAVPFIISDILFADIASDSCFVIEIGVAAAAGFNLWSIKSRASISDCL